MNRLLWRSRRGMLELDILLRDFIYQSYGQWNSTQSRAFWRLLDYPDALLLDLLMGHTTTADREIADVIEQIRTVAAS